jgi:hypothetical protein
LVPLRIGITTFGDSNRPLFDSLNFKVHAWLEQDLEGASANDTRLVGVVVVGDPSIGSWI